MGETDLQLELAYAPRSRRSRRGHSGCLSIRFPSHSPLSPYGQVFNLALSNCLQSLSIQAKAEAARHSLFIGRLYSRESSSSEFARARVSRRLVSGRGTAETRTAGSDASVTRSESCG